MEYLFEWNLCIYSYLKNAYMMFVCIIFVQTESTIWFKLRIVELKLYGDGKCTFKGL